MLIDSHCHIDFQELASDLPGVLSRMQENGVCGAICVGVTLEDFPKVQSIVENATNVVATLGVHPETTDVREPLVEELVAIGQTPEIVAIGETGLDYYWHKDKPEWQRERFRVHIRAARVLGKPLVIHNREATADVLRVLKEEQAGEVGGVFHCFTESLEIAQEVLEMGFHISISGIVTFKNAALVKEVASRVPLDRLLVETDSPYLAPVPYRGKLNQPAYVSFVAEEIARLRGISFDELATATTENCFRLFPFAKVRMTP